MGARETALRVLMSCRNNHAWADAALKAQLGRDGLVGPEAALCSRLVYGVVQNQQLLDFYLSAYCSQKPDHLQPPLLEILRLGAYQILYLDRVPDSAAVNTSVELAKISGRGQASGLVNAVLRKIAQNKTALPPIPERDEAKYLSIRYSHPKWLVKRLLSILGREEAEAFLAANNDTPPLTVQVNPLKTDAESLIKELEGWGVKATPHPWVPGCLELTGAGDLTTLAPFREGKLLVQDPAARLVSLIAGGSIRSSADVVKAIALGADACYIGTAALLALGCHLCRSCQTGLCSWGITTQRPELVKRLDIDEGSRRLVNLMTAWRHEIKEMMGGMGINSVEALRGNRLMLRGVGLTDRELKILGISHAGE